MEKTLDDYDVQMQEVIEASRKRRQRMDEFWINHPGRLAAEAEMLNPESTRLGGSSDVE